MRWKSEDAQIGDWAMELDSAEGSVATAPVMAVSLKLPEFWERQPRVWFAQAEAQFALKGITADETKFYYVVSALGGSTAARAMYILEDPPARGKYALLKGFLMETFCLSEAERGEQLLALNGLGDSKPSELMDHMLNLLGSNRPCFLFRALFMQQLPVRVRAALANSDTTDFRALAREADRFFAAGRERCTAVLAHTTGDLEMTDTIAVAAATRRQPQQSAGLCYFHALYGPKARRCRPPCSFVASGNARAGTR